MTTILQKVVKVLNRNIIPFDGKNTSDVIRELQDKVRDLQEAVNELQLKQLASRTLEPTGLPQHGARCEILDGQWISLLQSISAPTLVSVDHGLRRKPQGVLWVLVGSANNKALIAGEGNIAPADATKLTIRLNGSVGDTHIGILF